MEATPLKTNPRHPCRRGNILEWWTGLWATKVKVWQRYCGRCHV